MGQEVVVSQDQVLNISGHNAAADWRHPPPPPPPPEEQIWAGWFSLVEHTRNIFTSEALMVSMVLSPV